MFSGFFQTNFNSSIWFYFSKSTRGRENKISLQKQKFEFFNLKFLKIIFSPFLILGWTQMFDPRLACPAVSVQVIDLRSSTARPIPACCVAGANNSCLSVRTVTVRPSLVPAVLSCSLWTGPNWDRNGRLSSGSALWFWWLFCLGPRCFSALLLLLLTKALNFRQVLPNFSPTSPQPPIVWLATHSSCYVTLESNRFLLHQPAWLASIQLDCTHWVGDPVLPVCPAEHSQSALSWFHNYGVSCSLVWGDEPGRREIHLAWRMKFPE